MPRHCGSAWGRGEGRWTLALALVRLPLFFFSARREFSVLRVVIRVEDNEFHI